MNRQSHMLMKRSMTRYRSTSRSAFTLIEMLIAVGLVLLMMTLFAQIFGLASQSMNLQRALADNDQQVRTFVTVLRGDLQKRTDRLVSPYFQYETSDPALRFIERRGYFHISLNDAANGGDNVLQFTVQSTVKAETSDDSPYYGAATQLPFPGAGNFLSNPNQPEHDDGEIIANSAASSSAAEVTYFLRGGNLYRRQMLLREPLPRAAATSPQPRRNDDTDYFATASGALYPSTRNFFTDFDFSAIPSAGAKFIGTDSLDNSLNVRPLGQSRWRFGFNTVNGLPREYGNTTGTFFIGRFTHEETSALNFKYPQSACLVANTTTTLGNGNPFDTAGTPLTDTRNIYGNTEADGIADEFEQDTSASIPAGTRRGQDLLLTNVHSFQIEVWDERLGRFAPLAHSFSDGTGTPGDFHVGRQLNAGFVAPGGTAAIFDTWHPKYDRNGDTEDANGNGTLDMGEDTNSNGLLDPHYDPPPFRPLTWDPAGVSGRLPTNGFGVSEWRPDDGTNTYAIGDIVFPRTEDINYNGELDSGEDVGVPGFASTPLRIDSKAPVSSHLRAFFYRCVQGGTPGTAAEEPAWGSTPGQVIRETTAGRPVWVVESNVRPLKSIRITIRFFHVASQKMRQLTLVHSLTD